MNNQSCNVQSLTEDCCDGLQAEQRRKTEEAAATAVAASQPSDAPDALTADEDAADGGWTLEDDAVDDEEPQPVADDDAPQVSCTQSQLLQPS